MDFLLAHTTNPIPPIDPATPRHLKIPTYNGNVGSTSASRGSSVVHSTRDTDDASQLQYVREEFDNYLEKDLKNNRVFVDVKDFLEQVLRIPKDWRTSEKHKAMKDEVDAVLKSPEFMKAVKKYLASCKSSGKESRLYETRISLYSCVFQILETSVTSPAYVRRDPLHFTDGVFSKGTPDFTGLCQNASDQLRPNAKPRHPQAPFFEEIKDTGYALYNGQDGPCVMRDGESYCRLPMSSSDGKLIRMRPQVSRNRTRRCSHEFTWDI